MHWKRSSWLRFNISTLLIIVTTFCIWLGFRANQARLQREVVDAVQSAGGTVFYEHEDPHLPIADRPKPNLLERIVGIDFAHSIVVVKLGGGSKVDLVLSKVSQLPKLGELWMGSSDITDNGLRHLTRCSQLRKFSAASTDITDRGLIFLGKLKSLRYLDLANTQITNDGLEHLKTLRNLEELYLWGEQITDEGMLHLSYLKTLQKLHVQHSGITSDGVKHIEELANLRALCILPAASLDDRVVESIKKLKKLKRLSIDETGLTESAMSELKSLRLDLFISRRVIYR